MKNRYNNVIYICSAEKGASGGAKIIYDHSRIINSLKKDIRSQIIHIGKKKSSKWINSVKKFMKIKPNIISGWQNNKIEIKKKFKYDWFKNQAEIKNNFNFNKKDLIIFPEIFAHLAKKLCIDNKIEFGIFVQNGYCLESTNDEKLLREVYKKSKIILTYSKDILNCVKIAFPEVGYKIFEIKCSVNPKIKIKNKKNFITYMPRKMSNHSQKLIFFLKRKLPKNWKIISLNNISQETVYQNLAKSKIFLSFSEFEGLGLPPIEAAILENKVIGYSGEGGNEYFKKPIFTKINPGDLKTFLNEILKEIENKNFYKLTKKQLIQLKNDYSSKSEVNYIKKFLIKINQTN